MVKKEDERRDLCVCVQKMSRVEVERGKDI